MPGIVVVQLRHALPSRRRLRVSRRKGRLPWVTSFGSRGAESAMEPGARLGGSEGGSSRVPDAGGRPTCWDRGRPSSSPRSPGRRSGWSLASRDLPLPLRGCLLAMPQRQQRSGRCAAAAIAAGTGGGHPQRLQPCCEGSAAASPGERRRRSRLLPGSPVVASSRSPRRLRSGCHSGPECQLCPKEPPRHCEYPGPYQDLSISRAGLATAPAPEPAVEWQACGIARPGSC